MIFDISPRLSPELPVWPGDTPLSRQVLCDMNRGDNITLSTLTATVHLGAHADAPSHYGRDAPTIEQRGLERYLGPAQLITVVATRGTRIGAAALPAELTAPRLLLRTDTFNAGPTFDPDFAGLEPALIDELARRGVELVGVDTPSVDLFSSKDLPAHQAFLRHDIAILEGLRFDGVADGIYELIALPLALVGFDASPVRAVLRTLSR